MYSFLDFQQEEEEGGEGDGNNRTSIPVGIISGFPLFLLGFLPIEAV
jgi:hypothetical protein